MAELVKLDPGAVTELRTMPPPLNFPVRQRFTH